MKTHEILGEVAEVSPITTNTKKGGGSYKMASVTIKQFDKDRSYIHILGFNDIAESIHATVPGNVVIAQFEVQSKRKDIYWNTSVKATSIVKLPSFSNADAPSDAETGSEIEIEEVKTAMPEPQVMTHNVEVPTIQQEDDDEFERRLFESFHEPEKTPEPEPPKITFPSVLNNNAKPVLTADQISEAIQKMGPEKFAELFLNAQTK